MKEQKTSSKTIDIVSYVSNVRVNGATWTKVCKLA